MAHLWEEMSPHPATSFTSARGLESWAGSSAATAITKKVFGMCEGAAAAHTEEWREGPSTSWCPANVPHACPSHPIPVGSRCSRKPQPSQLALRVHPAQVCLCFSLSFPFGGGGLCSHLQHLKSLEPSLQ